MDGYRPWAVLVVVFSSHFVSTEAACGDHGHLGIGETFILKSPHYPYPYLILRDSCRWTFSTPENTITKLKCQVFHMID